MKKKNVKRVLSAALCGAMAVSMLAGCGDKSSSVSGTESASNEKYPETLTIDVFDSQANFQGIQSGWFAKVVKDKFNMELNIIAPNVAGGGDTLYQTRSANGNLGDLIITNLDNSRLKDLVEAGLVLDMTDYVSDCENLQNYMTAIEEASALSGEDGLWAVPSEVSNLKSTDPCEATDPTTAPSLRWDLYAECGYPEMNTLEDMLDVLEQMQNAAGTSDSGKTVYAFSLFKDWDGDVMQNADGLTCLYGYERTGFAVSNSETEEIQSVIDSDGIYVRALKFLFEANQRGLVDPESTTQNFDTLTTKYQDGAVLYSIWPWLGAGYYNTTENTQAGKGFATAVINDMKASSFGNMPLGKMGNAIMIGSSAKDPQRMADFIDWLYSPEGIEMSSASGCGPEGLTWELVDGKPVLTDFGVDAFVNLVDPLTVPDEWGGGTWKDGLCELNYKPVGVIDSDSETGVCYNYQKWEDYQEKTASALTEDWSAHYDNATTAIDYLNEKGLLLVNPGTNFAANDYTTDISTIKEQCKQIIVEDSWKMIFADSEDEFNSILEDMQTTVKGLGYDDVFAVDKQSCQDKFAAYEEAKAADQ